MTDKVLIITALIFFLLAVVGVIAEAKRDES